MKTKLFGFIVVFLLASCGQDEENSENLEGLVSAEFVSYFETSEPDEIETSDSCLNLDCDDHDPCTEDQCLDGQCSYRPFTDCCSSDAVCADENSCSIEKCTDNKCVYTFIVGCCEINKNCDDHDACTEDVCASGVCLNTAIDNCCKNTDDCEDDDPCTNSFCINNQCLVEQFPNCCQNATDCADDNDCSIEHCTNHQCQYEFISNCCTASDQCDDKNSCTADVCLNKQCFNDTVDDCCNISADCQSSTCYFYLCIDQQCQPNYLLGCCVDNLACHSDDPCEFGKCIDNICYFGEINGCCSADTDCNDDNPCTSDQCEQNKCVYQPVCPDECDEQTGKCLSATCADNSQCVIGESECYCDGNERRCVTKTGVCAGGQCDETVDSTNCASGCELGICTCDKELYDDSQCDDGNACTKDSCEGEGVCENILLDNCCLENKECEDDDSCTEDLCVNNICENPPVACQLGAYCQAGECIDNCSGDGDCIIKAECLCQGDLLVCSKSTGQCVGGVCEVAEDYSVQCHKTGASVSCDLGQCLCSQDTDCEQPTFDNCYQGSCKKW